MKIGKKTVFALLMTICMTTAVYAEDATLKNGIKAYKAGDYLGCNQIMEKVTKDSPGSVLAHYYMAMSYAQLGKPSEATASYDKVIFLDPGSQLAEYAEMGKQRLDPPKEEPEGLVSDEVLQGLQNTLFTDKVKKDVKKRQLELIKDKVNSGQQPEPEDYKDLREFSPKLNSKPTPEQIAEAYKTLAQAGINPYANAGAGMNAAMNPQLMEMSMLAGSMGGNNGGNNSMNMLPLLMMMQQGQGANSNVNPQAIQAMMSNMFMPNMMDLYESHDRD